MQQLFREIARRADMDVPPSDFSAVLKAHPPNVSSPSAAADEKDRDEASDPLSLPRGPNSAALFALRLSEAFPGVRGVEEIPAPVEAVERLATLLRYPLHQLRTDAGMGGTYEYHPFWWFRGGSNLHIDRFERLAADRILINIEEMRIRKVIAVRVFSRSERDFVYVETGGEASIGVYTYAEGEIQRRLEKKSEPECRLGYYMSEEYGLWQDRSITRAEYDDGAVVIDGKPILISRAELKVRYLTPYNFLLGAHDHVGIQGMEFFKALTPLMI
jgi:hypothetical protein